MNASERAKRDLNVMQLWVSGTSYRAIAAVVGLRSPQSVHDIVQKQLRDTDQRRQLLEDQSFAMFQERWERLFRAHWGPALDGNHRSAEICRKLLGQFAQVYGLTQQAVSVAGGTRRDAVEPESDDSQLDELAKLRAARARAYE